MKTLDDPRKEELLQWLVTAPELRELETHDQLGAKLGVSRRTLYTWKHEKEFHDEWDERAVAAAGDPERTQRVLDALFAQAVNPESQKQVQAAKAWADIAGIIKPPKKEAPSINTDDLTAAQIDELLVELLATKAEVAPEGANLAVAGRTESFGLHPAEINLHAATGKLEPSGGILAYGADILADAADEWYA